ncbi:hypothetical protein R1sor_003571 [Riccia sorocarpa]|uniref:Uncharacterized protein n=1 Tax=Riccia sorocarpa TaxID=122646 RepID=A0ABD3H848_9MARC
MAPASKRLVPKNLDVADVATNYTRRSVLSRRKSPVLEELFNEHHYDSEKGHYTQAANDRGTIWSDSGNREETTSSETRGSKDVEDRDDTNEDDMCDVSSPLMRRMSCPPAEDYSARRRRSYSSNSKGLSKDAYPMRCMDCQDTSTIGQPMRRMGCTEEAEHGSNGAEDSLLDLSPPTHIFLTLPSIKSVDVPALQNEVLETGESSSDDSPVRKATPPTKFRAKDLRVDVHDDDIS